ncbi:unnamed protein product [Spodoptera littoralis]|uniref:Uncharacterized protein n=1 Tax=Spodoptera littoralis TaxID=7109 RepID=A0A9P0IJV7_SPOLI|nr:unnamed protein product [Spodoptera littoralis]CAH1646371.1 unnamed protein product [Spodoptera littoralis]
MRRPAPGTCTCRRIHYLHSVSLFKSSVRRKWKLFYEMFLFVYCGRGLAGCPEFPNDICIRYIRRCVNLLRLTRRQTFGENKMSLYLKTLFDFTKCHKTQPRLRRTFWK